MDKQFFRDLAGNAAGMVEQALPAVTGSIAEPVAGLAAMYHAASGGSESDGVVNAIREAMTYQPRTEAGKMYQQALSGAVERIVQSAPIRTWKHGVDIAGDYSPAAGAMLRTVPAAIGVAAGAGPSLRTGRAVSGALNRAESFAPSRSGTAMGLQDGMIDPSVLKAGDPMRDMKFGGQRGAVMFRGGSPTGGGGMTWVTPDLSHAEDYARYHGGDVHQVEHTPSSVFDAGRDVN